MYQQVRLYYKLHDGHNFLPQLGDQLRRIGVVRQSLVFEAGLDSQYSQGWH